MMGRVRAGYQMLTPRGEPCKAAGRGVVEVCRGSGVGGSAVLHVGLVDPLEQQQSRLQLDLEATEVSVRFFRPCFILSLWLLHPRGGGGGGVTQGATVAPLQRSLYQ